MMALEFKISTLLPATPEQVYTTWLSAEGHSLMTGGVASITAEVGAEFDAWDGYIHGRNLLLEPGRLIVQSWRTVEFDESDPDSHLEISLHAAGMGTRLILKHMNLPSHGGQYKQGWVENYFEPMKRYFEGLNR